MSLFFTKSEFNVKYYVNCTNIMNSINANIFLGIFAVIATIGFLIMTSGQLVYGQESTEAATDLEALMTTISGTVVTIAGLAGAIIASFAKMSKKLGLATDDEISKMMMIANELHESDNWSKQLEKHLLAVAQVIEAMPGGKDMLEQKRVDLKEWKEDAAKLDAEVSGIYKKLLPILLTKK